MSRSRRITIAATVVLTTVLLLARPAAAHVTVSSPAAEKGGFGTITFQVPNEESDAGTNKVEVTFPADSPLAFVSVLPTPGWTATTETTVLPEPLEVEGEELTEAVSKITWEGGPLEPGQFQQFVVSAGPLPSDVDALEFPTIQTYDNGVVARWIEETPEGGEEPESPAPVLELTDPAGGGEDEPDTPATTATTTGGDEASASRIAEVSDDADGARTLGFAGIVVGALGLLAALAALAAGRRRTAS